MTNYKPTYKLFPKPTDDDAKGGWAYSFDFLKSVSDLTDILPAGWPWPSSMEEVEQVLFAVEIVNESKWVLDDEN